VSWIAWCFWLRTKSCVRNAEQLKEVSQAEELNGVYTNELFTTVSVFASEEDWKLFVSVNFLNSLMEILGDEFAKFMEGLLL
jgi:hypothetical protein